MPWAWPGPSGRSSWRPPAAGPRRRRAPTAPSASCPTAARPTPASASAAGSAGEAGGPRRRGRLERRVDRVRRQRGFVDREEELGVLREAWSSAKAGRRVLALVAGEPGIGKTALTAELARLVQRRRRPGAVRAVGRACARPVPGVPRGAGRLRAGLPGGACCAGTWPAWRRRSPGSAPSPRTGSGPRPPPQAAAEAERFRLFESLDTWIAADRGPASGAAGPG